MERWERTLRRKQRTVVIVEWLILFGVAVTLWQCGAAIVHRIYGG